MQEWVPLQSLPRNLRPGGRWAGDTRFAIAASRNVHRGGLKAELDRGFSLKTRQQWIDLLSAAGISAIENIAMPDFRDDLQVREVGLMVTPEHPSRGRVDHVGTTAPLSGAPLRLGWPALSELGPARPVTEEGDAGCRRPRKVTRCPHAC